MKKTNFFKTREARLCATVSVFVLLVYAAIRLFPAVASFLGMILAALAPILLGAFFAYLISLPMGFYERIWFPKSKKKFWNKTRSVASLFLALLSIAAVVTLVVALILPQLISCIRLIVDLVPRAYRRVVTILSEHELLSAEMKNMLEGIDWQSRVNELLGLVTSGFSGMMGALISTVTGVISGVITAFLSFIFSLYILIRKRKLARQFRRLATAYLPERFASGLFHVLSIANDCFHRYIVGQCIEAVILGVLCAIGMLLLQLPYAAMISALISFTALIPIAGAYIGAAVGAFIILPVSPVKSLIFLIFLVILQQLEGNLIYPKVVGSSLGLPAIWVLAAVTVGGGVMGIMGMFLGVPSAAVIYRLLREDVRRREQKKDQKEENPPAAENEAETQEQKV